MRSTLQHVSKNFRRSARPASRLLLPPVVALFGALWLTSCASKPTGHEEKPVVGPPTANAVAEKKHAPEIANERKSCSNGKEERVLEVQPKDGGCELAYTKGGATKTLATARKGDAHCKAVLAKTEANLKKSGYTCK